MSDIKIKIHNGKEIFVPKYTTYAKAIEEFNQNHNILAVLANNRIVSLNDKIDSPKEIKFLTINDTDGNRIYTAGIKMLFEYAVKKTFPDIKVRYSYSLPRGMAAGLEYEKYLTNEDISKIRKTMAQIVSDDVKIEKLTVKSSDGIQFFEDIGSIVKKENIQHIHEQVISLYRIDDLINYYYSEMPISLGYINKYEVRYLGKNRVVLNYPSENDNSKIPEYINYKGILEAYYIGQKWLEAMKFPYVTDINRQIYHGNIENFVNSCELKFNLEVNEAARHVFEHPNIKCILIAGPSSSGKTTVTKRLGNYLRIYGLDPLVISIDDYFVEKENAPRDEKGEYDFESVAACDVNLLADHVIKLFNGEEVVLPRFNFISGKKEYSDLPKKMKDNTVILFEGLHAINDSLLPMIPDTIKYKIFVSPFLPVCVDEHNFVSSYDLRLIRRIVRDARTRGKNIGETIAYWGKVRDGEEKYIIPYVHQADQIINTSLPYEVGALKVLAEPLLFSIEENTTEYNEARRLLNFLKQFYAVNIENIPKDSIVREFVGGNYD